MRVSEGRKSYRIMIRIMASVLVFFLDLQDLQYSSPSGFSDGEQKSRFHNFANTYNTLICFDPKVEVTIL